MQRLASKLGDAFGGHGGGSKVTTLGADLPRTLEYGVCTDIFHLAHTHLHGMSGHSLSYGTWVVGTLLDQTVISTGGVFGGKRVQHII
jgi:hypothetical protein